MITAYERLLALGRELQLVNDSAALLGWDQEVLLPKNGIAYRAEQMSWFSGYLHERFTADEVGGWSAEAEAAHGGTTDPVIAANLREWRHDYDHATCLPTKLVQDLAEVRVELENESRLSINLFVFEPDNERLPELRTGSVPVFERLSA